MKKFFLTFSIAMLILLPLATHAQLGGAINNLDKAVGQGSGTGLSSDLAGAIGTVIKAILGLV